MNSEYNQDNKRPRIKSTQVIMVLLAVFLSLVIGLSAGVAGVGYFLAANDVDVRGILTGAYSNNGYVYTGGGTSEEDGIIKRVEIIQSETASPVAAIAEKVIPSIVSVQITFPYTNFFFNQTEGVGEGSGIVLSEDGYIVTNNHVIEDALQGSSNVKYDSATIKVFVYGQLDTPYEAEVVGRDAVTDLAVLKIDAPGLVPIDIGNSDDIRVGDLAVAIGNPGGMMYMGSVTAGIISGLNRELYDETASQYENESLNLIQTDAAINPGNSGGALVDSSGHLIGINTVKIVSTGYEGLGFAIPVNKVMETVEALKTDGLVSRGRPNIGVTISNDYTAEIAEQRGLPEGVMVSEVGAFSPADKAGIKVNDIITEFNGVRVLDFDQLVEQKNMYMPGDEVSVKVYRQIGDNEDEWNYVELQLILGEANY
ncbi:MAG TPA: trypsin-like peptidase domain-containing protein [Clostridia bacterium]|nr:trypsin-like peptidase domain-containing protein [Clostridia bacterium]HPQ45830.1 trypsin-like peptidase domain-containing protein [Clostridia bacterium]